MNIKTRSKETQFICKKFKKFFNYSYSFTLNKAMEKIKDNCNVNWSKEMIHFKNCFGAEIEKDLNMVESIQLKQDKSFDVNYRFFLESLDKNLILGMNKTMAVNLLLIHYYFDVFGYEGKNENTNKEIKKKNTNIHSDIITDTELITSLVEYLMNKSLISEEYNEKEEALIRIKEELIKSGIYKEKK